MSSHLPRKATTIKKSTEGLAGVAYQIGVLLAIERNRKEWSQGDLGTAVGVDQVDVSNVENGFPIGSVTDAKIDALFKKLGLGSATKQASFVKWWRQAGR